MRPEKQLLLDDIKDQINRSTMLVITRYQNMNPNLESNFRKNMGKVGGSFEVVRKRILQKAAATLGIELDLDTLQGHIGVVFAEKDPIEITKAIYQFVKENEDTLYVLAGRFEGKLCSATDVEQISKLPSQEEMRAQLLATFEAPMGQMLAVVEALLTSLLYCLENKVKSSS